MRALAHVLAGMVVAGSVVVAVQGATQTAPAATGIAPAQHYTWRNVQVAGGGFVPGIVFNPTEPNLIYARTDIGGAYRWNESRVYLGTNGRGILYADPIGTRSDPLRDHAGGRFIGYALNLDAQGGDAMYRTVGAREFNIVTAENAMKWDATEPNQNQFTFGQADQVVSTAQANNQQIHGHTLVWHSQTPGWVPALGATQLRAAMQNHIATVVGRYAGSVRSWDVVNEAMNEDGSLRQSFWLNTLGQSYIADAFRFARAADPDAELCINDFNTDGMGAKSNGLFNLVQSLLRQGVPITCVGFQGHLAIQFSFPGQVRQNFQRFADLGLDVKITELDVRMQNPPDTTKFTTQAGYFRQMVEACLGVGARCDQITFWGFTDKFTWVPGTFPNECCPLLYDQNYNPKPAYTAVHDALAGGGPGDGGCRVVYSASNWGGSTGFTANVQITNTGAAAVNGWTLAFSFSSGQQVTQPGWGATWAQSTASVAATNLSWNANLAPNASTSIGFNGTHTGSNPAPAGFTLNGSACSTA